MAAAGAGSGERFHAAANADGAGRNPAVLLWAPGGFYAVASPAAGAGSKRVFGTKPMNLPPSITGR